VQIALIVVEIMLEVHTWDCYI